MCAPIRRVEPFNGEQDFQVVERQPSPGTERRLSICKNSQAVLRVHGIVLAFFVAASRMPPRRL